MKILKTLLCLFFLGLVALQLSSCAPGRIERLYDGDVLPTTEVTVLRTAPEVEVTSIRKDGSELSVPMMTSGGLNAHLLPGQYEIEARYRSTWQPVAGQFQTVRSEKVPFSINGKPGRLYRLNLQRPESLAAAKAFAKSPKITIEEEAAPIISPEEEKKGQVIFWEEKPAAATATQVIEEGTTVAAQDGSEYSPALKVLYKQATPKEREEFMKWAETQRSIKR